MSSSETADGSALVRQWFDDLFSDGDLPVADEILAEDVEYSGPRSLSPATVDGPEDVKEYVEVYRTGFPDLEYTVDDITDAGEQLVVQWTAMGTHRSPVFGVEPTGESFAIEGISLFTVTDGAITAVNAQWDTLKLVQELGTVHSEFGFEE